MKLRIALPAALCAFVACGDPASTPAHIAPAAPGAAGYEAAAREYAALAAREPRSALARYDLGTALLLSRKYAESREPLAAATRAADPALRARAHYNLGNSRLEPAFAQPKMQGRDDELRKAIDSYEEALLLVPGDLDAKWNLELARRLLARPPQGGGGGGGGGEGGGNDQQTGSDGPKPAGGGGGMSQQQAEEILAGSQQTELGVQQEKLRKPQPSNPTAH